MISDPRIPATDDGGFTLPEVLIALFIGTIIIGVISASLVVLLKNEGDTTDRLNASRTTQLVGTWLPVDTASAALSGWDCNGGCAVPASTFCASVGTKVLHIPYSKVGTDSNTIADYRLEPNGTTQDLVRYQCLAGGGPGTRLVLGHQLASAVATIDCPDAPNCTGAISVTVVVTTSQGLAATYTGDSRTGTDVAAPTTTSSGGGTTTTTTTPPQPCVVTSETLTPPSTGRVTANGSNKDKLLVNVLVTVTTTGSCSGLQISYHAKTPVITQPLTDTGTGTTWTATIPGTPTGDKWDAGTHPIAVTGATNSFSADLVVT